MDSGCRCETYGNIELWRSEVDSRIMETPTLRNALRLLVTSRDKKNDLYKCDVCGQQWQGSRAWNWDNWEDPTYLFKVPTISIEEWREEPYVQPHELLTFSASIERVLGNVAEKSEVCSIDGCKAKAIVGTVNCLPHHIQSLQKVRLLQQDPKGRWFPPYSQQSFRLNP
jgi:hypothetical protein